MESNILNQESKPTISSIFFDKTNIQTEIQKINSEKVKNSLPDLQNQLDDLEQEFKYYQKERIGQGYEKPLSMTQEQKEKKWNIEARIDIVSEELELLQDKLKNLNEKVVKESNANMLRWGLQCASKNHGLNQPNDKLIGQMAILDGQRVSMCPSGILIIDDEASPYNGMAVSDYRKLSKQWHADRLKKDDELLIILQKNAKLNGDPIPRATEQSFNRTVSKADLPKFPDWAKKYSMKVVDEEEVTYTRKPKYSNSRVSK
jgi:hypothetical protein